MKLKKIWAEGEITPDSYAEFECKFVVSEGCSAFLNIACDGMYVAYLNGKIAGFGQDSDYPYYKFYDKIDIKALLRQDNLLHIEVWHMGENANCYINDQPMLAFSVSAGKKTIVSANENTLSRKNVKYKNNYLKSITPQLGLSFYYDATKKALPYKKSVLCGEGDFIQRNIPLVMLGELSSFKVFPNADGYVIELPKECVGFIDMEFESGTEQLITVAFGERLESGVVPRKIGPRDFSIEYYAKKGNNSYTNYFRRIAAKYLQIYAKSPIEIKRFGIKSAYRQVKENLSVFSDKQCCKIYDLCVETLRLCMHDHYEDCPWREQSLYAMDARNQMLCGYLVFENNAFARYNIILMAKCKIQNGLMSMCFPSGIERYIPFFNLVYPIIVSEYVENTGDFSILVEVKSVIDTIFKTFSDKIDESGLIPNFPSPCWNFYEWTEGSDNFEERFQPYKKSYHLILNCMYVYACGFYKKLYGAKIRVNDTAEAIKKTFYNDANKSFRLKNDVEAYSQLGNSMAILAGIGGIETAKVSVDDTSLIPTSLSMNCFYYDALLSFGNRFEKFIIDDIKKKYLPMVNSGSTTVWETEKGFEDFENSGSMCHGWSSLPIYYFEKLLKKG